MAIADSGHVFLAYQVAPDSGGMTMRDYFAAKAMQAILGHPKSGNLNAIVAEGGPAIISRAAFEMADSMIRERNKPYETQARLGQPASPG